MGKIITLIIIILLIIGGYYLFRDESVDTDIDIIETDNNGILNPSPSTTTATSTRGETD